MSLLSTFCGLSLIHPALRKLISSGAAALLRCQALHFILFLLIREIEEEKTHNNNTNTGTHKSGIYSSNDGAYRFTAKICQFRYILIATYQPVQSIDVWLLIVIAFSGDNKTQRQKFLKFLVLIGPTVKSNRDICCSAGRWSYASLFCVCNQCTFEEERERKTHTHT